jgi:hypothetical protein
MSVSLALASIDLAAQFGKSLVDVSEQAASAADHLVALLGAGTTVDTVAQAITMPISTLVAALQPSEFQLPIAAGFVWDLQPADLPAPANAVFSAPLDGDNVSTHPRPTSAMTAHLVPTAS